MAVERVNLNIDPSGYAGSLVNPLPMPVGRGSGSGIDLKALLDQAMRLRNAIAKAQISAIKEEVRRSRESSRFARKDRQDEFFARKNRRSGRERGPDYGSAAAALLSSNRAFRQPFDTENLAQWLRFIGPDAAHRGLMQSGALLGQTRAGINNPQPESPNATYRLTGDPSSVPESPYNLEDILSLQKNPSVFGFEKGTLPGTIPETGETEVHKGEVILSKDQVDEPLLRYLIRDKLKKLRSGQMDGKGTGPGRKRGYQGGSLQMIGRPSSASPSDFLRSDTAPMGLRKLFTMNRPELIPEKLRGLSSMGSLGHLFAGSDAGPAGNPFNVGGGFPGGGEGFQPPGGSDVMFPLAGETTPGRSPVLERPALTQGMGTSMTRSPSPRNIVPSHYQYDPFGNRIGSSASRGRYIWGDRGGPVSGIGSTPREMQGLTKLFGGRGFRRGTLPNFQTGTLQTEDPDYSDAPLGMPGSRNVPLVNPNEAPMTPGVPTPPPTIGPGEPPPGTTPPGTSTLAKPSKPWWWLRMRGQVEGLNPFAKKPNWDLVGKRPEVKAPRVIGQQAVKAGLPLGNITREMMGLPPITQTPPAPSPTTLQNQGLSQGFRRGTLPFEAMRRMLTGSEGKRRLRSRYQEGSIEELFNALSPEERAEMEGMLGELETIGGGRVESAPSRRRILEIPRRERGEFTLEELEQRPLFSEAGKSGELAKLEAAIERAGGKVTPGMQKKLERLRREIEGGMPEKGPGIFPASISASRSKKSGKQIQEEELARLERAEKAEAKGKLKGEEKALVGPLRREMVGPLPYPGRESSLTRGGKGVRLGGGTTGPSPKIRTDLSGLKRVGSGQTRLAEGRPLLRLPGGSAFDVPFSARTVEEVETLAKRTKSPKLKLALEALAVALAAGGIGALAGGEGEGEDILGTPPSDEPLAPTGNFPGETQSMIPSMEDLKSLIGMGKELPPSEGFRMEAAEDPGNLVGPTLEGLLEALPSAREGGEMTRQATADLLGGPLEAAGDFFGGLMGAPEEGEEALMEEELPTIEEPPPKDYLEELLAQTQEEAERARKDEREGPPTHEKEKITAEEVRLRQGADKLWEHLQKNVDRMSDEEYKVFFAKATRLDQLADRMEKRISEKQARLADIRNTMEEALQRTKEARMQRGVEMERYQRDILQKEAVNLREQIETLEKKLPDAEEGSEEWDTLITLLAKAHQEMWSLQGQEIDVSPEEIRQYVEEQYLSGGGGVF